MIEGASGTIILCIYSFSSILSSKGGLLESYVPASSVCILLRQLKSQYFDLVANSSKNSSHELKFLTWTPKYFYRQCVSFFNGISGITHSERYHKSVFREVRSDDRGLTSLQGEFPVGSIRSYHKIQRWLLSCSRVLR